MEVNRRFSKERLLRFHKWFGDKEKEGSGVGMGGEGGEGWVIQEGGVRPS